MKPPTETAEQRIARERKEIHPDVRAEWKRESEREARVMDAGMEAYSREEDRKAANAAHTEALKLRAAEEVEAEALAAYERAKVDRQALARTTSLLRPSAELEALYVDIEMALDVGPMPAGWTRTQACAARHHVRGRILLRAVDGIPETNEALSTAAFREAEDRLHRLLLERRERARTAKAKVSP